MTVPALPLARWETLADEATRLAVRRVPSNADVDDIVQEVLVRVWRTQDALPADERFRGWLASVVRNAATDHLRARQRQRLRSVPLTEAPEAAPPEGPAEDGDVRTCLVSVLRPFVAELPARYRTVIELSELDGLSHARIAARLGLSVSGVKSRVQRGRGLLRAMLERCCAIAVDARGAPVSCEWRPDGVRPSGCCPETPAPLQSVPARRRRSASATSTAATISTAARTAKASV